VWLVVESAKSRVVRRARHLAGHAIRDPCAYFLSLWCITPLQGKCFEKFVPQEQRCSDRAFSQQRGNETPFQSGAGARAVQKRWCEAEDALRFARAFWSAVA